MLEWKVGIFASAGVLGLAGMYLGERWLTGAAILLLLGAVLLRSYTKAATPPDGDDVEDEAP